MSVHIDSFLFSSGSSSNGTWDFNDTITGNYTLISQTMDTTAIPWITENTNEIQVQSGSTTYTLSLLDEADYETYRFNDDLTEIATYIQNRLNAIDLVFTTTVTLVDQNTKFKIVSDQPITLKWATSSCKVIFGKSLNETGTTFYLSTHFITCSPKHLYMTIDESSVNYITSTTFNPTLILSTTDNELVNQNVYFRSFANQLNIKIYRLNILTEPIDLLNQWEIILSKT